MGSLGGGVELQAAGHYCTLLRDLSLVRSAVKRWK